MKHALRRIGCLTTGMLICHTAAAQLQGRGVGDVLDGLRSEGLIFIYNTQIVPASFRIDNEPQARSGLALAREPFTASGCPKRRRVFMR